jgi:NAD(P)-dependent dehydrogenase (short-subunit alcohol dehydrogenase family)
MCDVANHESWEAMLGRSVKAFGRVDIVVNEAALFALNGA